MAAGDVEDGVSMMVGVKCMKSNDQTTLHPNRIYLDSFSYYNSMFNKKPLENIREVYTFLYRHCNIGVSRTNWVENYGDIYSWLYINCISEIFSVPVIDSICYHITYDSDDGY